MKLYSLFAVDYIMEPVMHTNQSAKVSYIAFNMKFFFVSNRPLAVSFCAIISSPWIELILDEGWVRKFAEHLENGKEISGRQNVMVPQV